MNSRRQRDYPSEDGVLVGLLAGRARVELGSITADQLSVRRNESKAILPAEALPTLFATLPDDWQVVSAGAMTTAPYDTIYFDTRDLHMYRAHRQGRLRRAKVRTRRYADSTTFLEVKIKGPAGLTEKFRRLHFTHGALDGDDFAWIGRILDESLGHDLSRQLSPIVWTRYRRTVIRAPDGSERLTIDADLTTGLAINSRTGGHVGVPTSRALIIELKSVAPRSRLLQGLRRSGGRPVSLSKYAVGIATHYEVHATRWRHALRRIEGVQ